MDYAKLKQARINDSKIAPYQMITAVSQRAINFQLKAIYNLKLDESLQKLTVVSADPKDDFSRLVATLDAPTVFLRLGENSHVVVLQLNIKSGTLKYRAGGKNITLPLPACALAFAVNLSFVGADFASLPKPVQARLKSKNDYSVKQLLVDFTSANIAGVDVNRSTVYNYVKEGKTEFNKFIQRWFASLGKKNGYVIHNVPLATPDGRKVYPMPTVVPTDIAFQNMGFVASGSTFADGNKNNMLLYLQATGGTALPKTGLEFSANWVVPTPNDTDDYDGTVALSRSTFLAGWLMPKLAEFNKASTWVPTVAEWTQKGFFTFYRLAGVLGRQGATPAELAFNTWPIVMVDPAYTAQVGNKTPGNWYKYYYIKQLEDGGVFNVFQNAVTENVLFIPTGYNDNGMCKIFLWGNTAINLYARLNIGSGSTSSANIIATWSTTITLDGVNDGELIISIDNIKPVINKTFEGKPMQDNATAQFAGDMEEGLKKLDMAPILKSMRSVLTNEWDFVLPGGGDFYINKAVFNAEQDLLCELKYKFQA